MNLLHAPTALLLLGAAACNQSGDYESNCTLTCSLADGGILQSQQRVACCGEHANPTHLGEEGSACTVDWVNDHTRQLCQARSFGFTRPDGGFTTTICPASQFQCNCTPPATYPSYDGCD